MREEKRTVGEIVAEDYRTAKIFEAYGIDFCCGGNVDLRAACNEKKINLASLIKELKTVKNKPVEQSQNFSGWEISFLTLVIL